jgi:drug/metabolite transporter (DMT)-like permease
MPPGESSSIHLLLPFFASILFVIGALFAKASTVRGVSPYTNTFTANLCLGVIWGAWGGVRAGFLPPAAWGPALLVAIFFVLGQLLTYLTFQLGDVSLATPILGVKIILVAVFSSVLFERPIPGRIWVAAVLASIGIAIVQAGGGGAPRTGTSRRQVGLTVLLAILASTLYSLFDVSLQAFGARHGGEKFLSTMFAGVGVLSCLLLPWTDSPRSWKARGAGSAVVLAALLMAGQAVLIASALGQFGDATRVNIVYALRGLWSVVLAWMLNRLAANPEGRHSVRTMLFRLVGAAVLLVCVLIAMS